MRIAGFVLLLSASVHAESSASKQEAAIARAATPGPEHQRLQKLAGRWKLQVVSWTSPGGPAHKSEATAEFQPILGGRYMQQQIRGTSGFEGMGIAGYDNVTKERFETWVDTFLTGAIVVRGRCPAGAKKCTFKGTMPDAMLGRQVAVTETLTMIDEDHFTFEMHGPGAGGKAFKMMEISYARQ